MNPVRAAVTAPDDTASVATFGGLPRSPLAFRFGFLAVRSGSLGGDEIRALRNRNWIERTVGGIALWRQPDAVVQVFEADAATFVLVGEVYSETDADIGARIADLPSGRDDALYAFVSDLCGRFALLLIEGERVRVLNDPIGSRSIFYHERLPFAVASHALVLAAAIGAERCPEVAAYLADPASASRKTSCLPGDQTLYRHIHALVPNNLFDTEGMRTHRYGPRAARRDTNQEAFFAAADASLASLARHVRGRYTPVLGSTGGVDTRAAMAALRSLETPFETVTWNRDTLSARESGIVDQLNAHLQTPHADLPRLKRTGHLGRVTTANGGGFRSPSSKAVAMHAALGERPDIIFLRGWGAEILRGFYNLLPTRMRDLTPSEMARMYFSPQGKTPPDGTTEFFEAYFSRGNYAGLEALGYDPNDLFYWEHRMGMWGALSLNEMDLGIRTLVCFNSRRLFEAAWGLPPEKRLTKDLLLDFVARHDPALAAMPLDRQRTAASEKKVVKPSEIAPRATERREHAGWLFHLRRRLRSAAGIRSADNRREGPE